MLMINFDSGMSVYGSSSHCQSLCADGSMYC